MVVSASLGKWFGGYGEWFFDSMQYRRDLVSSSLYSSVLWWFFDHRVCCEFKCTFRNDIWLNPNSCSVESCIDNCCLWFLSNLSRWISFVQLFSYSSENDSCCVVFLMLYLFLFCLYWHWMTDFHSLEFCSLVLNDLKWCDGSLYQLMIVTVSCFTFAHIPKTHQLAWLMWWCSLAFLCRFWSSQKWWGWRWFQSVLVSFFATITSL